MTRIARKRVPDTSAGSFATAKDCLQLPENQKIGWIWDKFCLFLKTEFISGGSRRKANSEEILWHNWEKWGGRSKRGVLGGGRCARVYMESWQLGCYITIYFFTSIDCALIAIRWKCVQECKAAQKLPTQLHSATTWKIAGLVIQYGCEHASSAWRLSWRNNFKENRRYIIQKLDLYAIRTIGNGEVIVHYYGFLIHSNPSKNQKATETNEESVLQATTKEVRKWANKVLEKTIDYEVMKLKTWVVQAPYSAMQFSNYARDSLETLHNLPKAWPNLQRNLRHRHRKRSLVI